MAMTWPVVVDAVPLGAGAAANTSNTRAVPSTVSQSVHAPASGTQTAPGCSIAH